MRENIIEAKSYSFVLELCKIILKIAKERKEFIISNQLIKSATSIGANIAEAQGGQTSKDFLLKISIAYKEALETKYWLRLYTDLNYLDLSLSKNLLNNLDEIIRILSKIKVTTRNKIKNEN